MKYQDTSSMEVDQQNIENIFGKPKRTLLFNEEEYQSLLQQILSIPNSTYDKTKLPFGNTPKYHIDDSLFSKILTYPKATVSEILSRIVNPILNYKLNTPTFFVDNGKFCNTLTYPKTTVSEILSRIVNPILNYKLESDFTRSNATDRHLFLIDEPGVCWAYGFYDVESNGFYILKGSRFAKKCSTKHPSASSAATRIKLINTACVEKNDLYLVTKDFKCRSAKSAASVVMGRVSHYAYWKDRDGRLLADIYPQYFIERTVPYRIIRMNADS